ncbi:HNH endonuclease [Amycolatopsis palatopharyngis]|uniref:HNH endonuclease n=1 Tax=Amycolatopsis palatopharyngis TaxID=187982 RepID=UPI0013BE8CED|nr:HNH endonuclease signature motif containing protein [Amycolatopsis palatopharyngis]
MIETDELVIPDWDINDLLDIPACSLDEREALEMVRSIGQVQSMLEAARLQAVQRLARLRSDDEWSVDLLATSCKVSLGRAGEDVALANTLSTRLPRTMAALAAGALDPAKVRQIDRATTPLSDEHVLAVEERVFPAARDKTPRQLAYTLRIAVHAVDPEGAAARARARRQERRVSVEHQDEGMSWLNALLATPDVLAIKDLLDGLAREVNTTDDPRTMDQLRADVLRDLLLGHQHSRVRVHVYVTATAGTVLGQDDQPGDLRGYGPIPADTVRALALGLNATWRGVKVDNHGHPCGLAERGYAPSATLRELVQLRDRTCRFPACGQSAHRCDLDHHVPYRRDGITCPCNLHSLCRRHHRLKQSGTWTVTTTPAGDLQWTTPHGRVYVDR